jgi:hypothetical protein
VVGIADFNRDGHPDYLLENGTGQTAIWYLSGRTLVGGAYGPTIPSGWDLVGTADFNGDGYPDYVLYNATTRQTAIWYLRNNVSSAARYSTLPVTGAAVIRTMAVACNAAHPSREIQAKIRVIRS